VALPFRANVFLHGDWSLEDSGFSTTDPEILSLAAELRARASQARAASTFSSYSGPWARFKAWCLSKGVSFLGTRFPLDRRALLDLSDAHCPVLAQPSSDLLGGYLPSSPVRRAPVPNAPPSGCDVPRDRSAQESRWSEREEAPACVSRPSPF
jgi:hypothetical protein